MNDRGRSRTSNSVVEVYRLRVFVVLLFAAATAHAAPDASRLAALDYSASDLGTCPDAATFRDAVAAHLGYDPFVSGGPRTVQARIRRAGHAFRGTVELRDATGGAVLGAKTLESSRCDELVSTMSFAVSMAIDPVRALQAKPGPAAAEAEPSAAAPPLPVTSPAHIAPRAASELSSRLPPAPPARRLSLLPRVFAGGGVAALGPIAGGMTATFAAGAGLAYGAAFVDLEGRFLAPSSEAAGDGQVRTSTFALALLPCARLSPLFACAEASFGALQGAGETTDGESATTFFSQAGVRFGAAIHTAWFDIEPIADGLATLTRTEATFRGSEVWSTHPLGLSGGARLVMNLL